MAASSPTIRASRASSSLPCPFFRHDVRVGHEGRRQPHLLVDHERRCVDVAVDQAGAERSRALQEFALFLGSQHHRSVRISLRSVPLHELDEIAGARQSPAHRIDLHRLPLFVRRRNHDVIRGIPASSLTADHEEPGQQRHPAQRIFKRLRDEHAHGNRSGLDGNRRTRSSRRGIIRRTMPDWSLAMRWWRPGPSPFQRVVRQGLSEADDRDVPRRGSSLDPHRQHDARGSTVNPSRHPACEGVMTTSVCDRIVLHSTRAATRHRVNSARHRQGEVKP